MEEIKKIDYGYADELKSVMRKIDRREQLMEACRVAEQIFRRCGYRQTAKMFNRVILRATVMALTVCGVTTGETAPLMAV